MNRKVIPVELGQYLRMGIRTYRGKLFVQASFWLAAIAVGVFAIYFAKLIELVQNRYIDLFDRHVLVISLATPVAFWAAAAVAKHFAPHAGGSGIPQALYTATLSKNHPEEVVSSGLVSLRTAAVKVISTAISFVGGASVGAEGPTVQISTAIFAWSGNLLRKYFPGVSLQSYIVAGAGAGIAAAFNTPIGGVAFALEEVALSEFGELKHLVMLSVIVAGLATQALLGGNALYLGNPGLGSSDAAFIPWAAVIGLSGGVLGALFGKLVTSERLYQLKTRWWVKALFCGIIVSVINFLFKGITAGNGYVFTRNLMLGTQMDRPLLFPLAKLLATAVSTISGLGGGILAPSLTVGAWMGASLFKITVALTHIASANLKVCALFGMVAYLTGAFQIPLTSVLIVMEMTDQHGMIFPMMITAVISFAVAKAIMPVSLYHKLIQRSYVKRD